MSNTSTGNNMMNKSSSTTSGPKRVTKKSDTPAEAAAAPAVATPAPAVVKEKAPAQKKAKKTEEAVAAPAVAAPTPVVAAATAVPSASAPVSSEAAAVESKTVEQEIDSLVELYKGIRDSSVSAIKTLQRLQKRVARDLKEASSRRRRRVKKDDDDSSKVKRPSTFTTPTRIKDGLCELLGLPKDTFKSPADCTRLFSSYINQHNLKDPQNGQIIHPNDAMKKAFGLTDNEGVSYRNIQRHLYRQYDLPKKVAK